jgi:hypothetical protein
MTEVVVMLSFFDYLLRLKNIIALAPFHREFELTSFQCQLKGDFIDTSYTSVQYSSFDRAVVMIKKLGFKAVFKNGRKIYIYIIANVSRRI